MKDLIFEQQRAEALTVECQHCHQPTGQPCVNPRTDRPLEHQPAHQARLKAAKETP